MLVITHYQEYFDCREGVWRSDRRILGYVETKDKFYAVCRQLGLKPDLSEADEINGDVLYSVEIDHKEGSSVTLLELTETLHFTEDNWPDWLLEQIYRKDRDKNPNLTWLQFMQSIYKKDFEVKD